MQKRKVVKIIAIIIILILILVVAAFFLSGRNLNSIFLKNNVVPTTTSSQDLSAVPVELGNLLDFSGVKPYGIKKEVFSDGIERDTIKYNTAHLFGNYVIINDQMTKNNGFIAENISAFSNDFSMIFMKGSSKMEVNASTNTTDSAEPNTITIVFNHSINNITPTK